jgi:hypothetical protein
MRRLVSAVTACLLVGLGAGAAPAAPLTWTAPVTIDRYQPFGSSDGGEIACAGTSFCISLGDFVTSVSHNPAADPPAWSIPRPIDVNGRAVACPSASFCVLVGGEGKILASTNPGADPAVWKQTLVPLDAGNILVGLLEHLSCPTTTFCVAADRAGHVYASNDPAAASPTWTASAGPVMPGISSLSCASSTLCVVTGDTDNVRISTNPGAAPAVWSAPVDITPADAAVTSVSCPATTFCMAGSQGGTAYRTVNPSAAAPEWAAVTTTGNFSVSKIVCPTTGMCTAIGGAGVAITTTNPLASTPDWRVRNLNVGIWQLVCGTESFCMISAFADSRTFVARDAAQASPSPTWNDIGAVIGWNALASADCPSETLCVAGDTGGRILATADPTAIAPTWRMQKILGANTISGLDCPSPILCVGVTLNSRSVISHNPGAVTPTWVTTFGPFGMKDVACPTVDRCVAINATGSAAVLSDVRKIATIDEPGPVWGDPKDVDGATGLLAMACPTATHCAAVDSTSSVFTTADVAAADPVWQKTTPPGVLGGGLEDISCPTVDLCVAVERFVDRAYSSTNPFAAAPVWNGPVASGGWRVSCPSPTFCLAGTGATVRTATDLAPAIPAWSAPVLAGDDRDLFTSIACANDRLCLLGSDVGQATLGVAVPQNTAPPAVSGGTVAGSTLTAATGAWTGVPSTASQWERCDSAGAGCTAVPGATGTTYAVTAADVASTLRVRETATNAGGSASAASAVTSVVPPLPVVATPTPTPVPVPVVPNPVVTTAMIKALLQEALTSRLTSSFTAPTAGRLVVRWYSLKTKRKKAVLLASGRVDFTAAGKKKVVVKLNRAGKKLLRRAKRLKITVKATWTPLGGKAVTVSRKVTLKR